ncbi:uncharacterized protein map3k19 isoform X3 [Anguilla anguilla]|uniref:uncharacterized protein map3k19 isoform X3 n=1 Tax=Anguilla anguilla TaxID=7936 RepID=UPI0015AAE603|nr:uncharacterized protein map3k19 isoform X3 [Anguilla anguilla]
MDANVKLILQQELRMFQIKGQTAPLTTTENPVSMSTEFIEAVLDGDLETVGRRMEEGHFSPEEVDRPLSEGTGTALIAACQRGHTRAVQFLLEKGADITLCNHNDQTAVHLSGPVLQGELLAAACRRPSPQTQLLCAAWRGDLHSLQNLLVQKEQVDVNVQNRDGLTPLMLAVRDVDLFEGLETQMTWEYRPVEVVAELLGLQAVLAVCDQRGRCALYYAAQVKSPLRDELLQLLLESLSQPVPMGLGLDPDCCDPEELSENSPDSALTSSVLIQATANTEGVVESSEGFSFSKDRKTGGDQRISLSFQTAAETLRKMRQEYQELEGRSSPGTSLPSLWDRGRRSVKLCTLDTGQNRLKTKGRYCLPAPPRPAGKGDPVHPNLTGPHPPQLTQSAPVLAEPLLDSGSLLRVRAHIQTRLVRSEPDAETHRRKRSLPALIARPVRTPKLLAPLVSGQREEAMMLGCKHPLPLKPIGLLPLTSVSKARRERLAWRVTHGPHRARGGGSEGSSSSSVSSQGSLDLEEEEEEEEETEEKEETSEGTGVSVNQPTGSKEVPPATVPCESFALDLLPTLQPFVGANHETADFSGKQGAIDDCMEDRGSIISSADRTEDCEVLFGAARSELAHGLGSELPERMGNSTDVNKTEHSIDSVSEKRTLEQRLTGSPFPEKNADTVTETTSAYDLKSQCTADTNQLGLRVVNITVSESDAIPEEKSNPSKTHHIKDKGNRTPFQTNQSFNILAHKDHNRFTRKSKSNQRNTSRAAHLKGNIGNPPDLTLGGEATAKPSAPRTSHPKASQKTTTLLLRNRSAEQLRPVTKRSGTDRGSTNKLEVLARKQPLQRDLKCTRQPKKLATPRAKSAVDFVTYSDMFQEINQGDNGPAIYEMFATPVYDNLRMSTSRARASPRQVQSAPPRKNLSRRNQKHFKPLESSRKKKTQRSSPASGKSKKRSDVLPRGKPRTPLASEDEEENVVFISGLNWQIKTAKSEPVYNEADTENESCVEGQEEQNLSVIEEVLSNYLSETLVNHAATGSENPSTSPEPQEKTQQTLNDHLPAQDEGPAGNSLQNDSECEKPKSSHSPSFLRQPKRNTWTSGSSDRTMSPMFRKYLDVAGEGPLTDDLLQCLAKELISLEEREVTLQPENRFYSSSQRGIQEVSQAEKGHPLLEVTVSGAKLPSCLQGVTSSRECSAPESPTEGAVLWTKGEVLGRGAYGTVYCGLTDQGQLIAVKQVALDDSDQATAAREYRRLQDEVDLLKTLCHVNIVGFLGTTLQDNVVSIFMEYVPGGSIASIIHRFGPLPERVLSLYTQQILEGVAYLHENRVIHRDLKGNNVMLMPTGVVKLIDFGCARRLSCLSHSSSNGELLRSVHGTPFWMAPEVINETGHGRKSDIWSVGCTVFEMATGRPPLAHMDKIAALFYIGARRGLMPTLPDEFSEDARNFVQACLTSDQRDRPSAQELLLHPFIPSRPRASSSS